MDKTTSLHPYILTHGGTRVEGPGGQGSPSLMDVAVQCGRLARFAGATHFYWPVLLHSMVVHEILIGMGYGHSPRIRLEGLIHDAHEAITGDIPAPFKEPQTAVFQDELDRRFYKRLGIDPPDEMTRAAVREADHRALLAEAKVLGAWADTEWEVTDDYCYHIVETIQDRYPSLEDVILIPSQARNPKHGRAIRHYVAYVRELVDDIKGEKYE